MDSVLAARPKLLMKPLPDYVTHQRAWACPSCVPWWEEPHRALRRVSGMAQEIVIGQHYFQGSNGDGTQRVGGDGLSLWKAESVEKLEALPNAISILHKDGATGNLVKRNVN